MINDYIKSSALELGFAGVYMLRLAKLEDWRVHALALGTDHGMPYDISIKYPDAFAVAMLVWAYSPFETSERISPYYIASNASYHAAKKLEASLKQSGFSVERAFVPARALALANGLGHQGKNGLMSIAPYGTRIVLETLIINQPCEFSVISDTNNIYNINYIHKKEEINGIYEEAACPSGCTACINACPMGAISQNGLDVKRCMRYIMDSGYTDEVRKKQATFLGCEACQNVCPKNSRLTRQKPSEAIKRAFDIKRLLDGDTRAAREIVGRNITGNGRLTMEAIAFAARDGMYEGEIRACLNSPFEQVRQAAGWAISEYFDKLLQR